MSEKHDRPKRDGGENRRPRRDGDARPHRSSDGRPRRDGDARPQRSGDSRPRRDGDARPRRDGDAAPRREGGERRSHAPRAGSGRASERPTGGIRPRRTDADEGRPRHDDPPIPDDVTGRELDRVARAELKALSKENAERVAQHLVMAARLIDEDPELAHKHAQAAARRGGRIAVARETLGITAYLTGDFALALRELRTHRRISGSNEQVPLMVDCERGLGRPEKALELGRSVDRSELSVGTRVELAIAMSGARLDLGQTEAALRELEIPQLDPSTAYSFSPALFDSYAVVLAELGRESEAAEWGRRADIAAQAIAEAEGGAGDDEIEVIEEGLDDVDDDATEGEATPGEEGDDVR
ncbi:hypothetical protein EV140_1129 [Microcella alkaliphila]|uniref:TPR-repeat-containing protein n=2 Tax=Microcella alkaliphila TaxID=279828 RepID=A0A4Q7TP59_9MICO|nr:hypothetical protein EV140_1129 [Microcella alkaliphila]